MTDVVTINEQAFNYIPDDRRFAARVRFGQAIEECFSIFKNDQAAARSPRDNLKRLESMQAQVLAGLQHASQTILTDAARIAAERDTQRDAKLADLESKLRAELAQEGEAMRKKIETEEAKRNYLLDTREESIKAREEAITEREKQFETKEAAYVARQKIGEQAAQLKAWTESWQVTTNTNSKREPIRKACIVGLWVFGGSFLIGFAHNVAILWTPADLAQIQAWQWVLVSLKTIIPAAGFSSILVYYIKWSSAWAKRHADEEFQMRSRLVDLGRSAWLIEAVRDAAENGKDLPPELLTGLSRNLYSNSTAEDDVQPHALADFVAAGLQRVVLKGPDGSSVEAETKGKRK
ncbi:MAG: hypothetical protein SFV32_12600 [Opitutaceae bacterium]|nr:hypothetical protein [Opitutaceae bacterium]